MPPRFQYLRTTLSQLLVVVIGLPVAYFLAGTPTMVSLLCGAACAVIPHAYFALRMARAARVSAQRAARLGLAAEGGKFLLSAAAFAVVFAVVKPEQPGLVFLSFAVLWLVQIIDAMRFMARA
ncbi:MAG: ATP synthase subunit I [Congregibacter sp.]